MSDQTPPHAPRPDETTAAGDAPYAPPAPPSSSSQPAPAQPYTPYGQAQPAPQQPQYSQPQGQPYQQYPEQQHPQQPQAQPYQQQPYYGAPAPQGKSRIAAGLLGIFLGSLGIHRFYLGYTAIGLTQLLVTVGGWVLMIVGAVLAFAGIGIPIFFLAWMMVVGVGIWGLVEGILFLASQQGTFSQDAQGRPLVS